MTTKLPAPAPKGGKPSPKKPAPAPARSPSKSQARHNSPPPSPKPASSTPAAIASGDSSASPEAASGTPTTPAASSEPAPASASASPQAALDILTSEQAAASAPPSGIADDAATALRDAAALSAATSEPAKRRGGFPKGAKRGPDGKLLSPGSPASDGATQHFPPRTGGATGASPDERTVAELQQRIAVLEAQQSEDVKAALSAGFAQIARVGFAIMARRNGTHWFLDKGEADEIGEACSTAALPYISAILPALPIIAAAGAIYGAASSRMDVDIEIEQGKRQRVMPGSVKADA